MLILQLEMLSHKGFSDELVSELEFKWKDARFPDLCSDRLSNHPGLNFGHRLWLPFTGEIVGCLS